MVSSCCRHNHERYATSFCCGARSFVRIAPKPANTLSISRPSGDFGFLGADGGSPLASPSYQHSRHTRLDRVGGRLTDHVMSEYASPTPHSIPFRMKFAQLMSQMSFAILARHDASSLSCHTQT